MNGLVRLGLIGGSGFESLFSGTSTGVKTYYGNVSPIFISKIGHHEIVFISRHGTEHEVPPHKVNYRGIIAGLAALNVERVIATNAVGAINTTYSPGDIVIPSDILDLSFREGTFFNSTPVRHVDMTHPYCGELRELLICSARSHGCRAWTEAIMVCTQGPRFETSAEIRMLRIIGGDIVGMTGAPEVFLAREAGLCYASLSFISNMAAGIQERISQEEVVEIATKLKSRVSQIIVSILDRISESRRTT